MLQGGYVFGQFGWTNGGLYKYKPTEFSLELRRALPIYKITLQIFNLLRQEIERRSVLESNNLTIRSTDFIVIQTNEANGNNHYFIGVYWPNTL